MSALHFVGQDYASCLGVQTSKSPDRGFGSRIHAATAAAAATAYASAADAAIKEIICARERDEGDIHRDVHDS